MKRGVARSEVHVVAPAPSPASAAAAAAAPAGATSRGPKWINAFIYSCLPLQQQQKSQPELHG